MKSRSAITAAVTLRLLSARATWCSTSVLWSGCISGAYREDLFLEAFERAGFYGMEIVKRDERPWRTIDGTEFRSVTVVAHKGKQGACWGRKQAVIYRSLWCKVVDDDGHTLERGKRTAVFDKTFQLYSRAAIYGQHRRGRALRKHPARRSHGVRLPTFDVASTARDERRGLQFDRCGECGM